MGFFTPRRCDDSCKCKPGCACEIRLTFEPRIGSLHCQFNVDIELFRVCDGVETELDPADYDIRARFESSADGVVWTTEIESNANTVKFVLLDFRGASGYLYRLTAWEGAGSTGEDCAEGIDEEAVTYFEDRVCNSDDCCSVSAVAVNIGALVGNGILDYGCCWGGGSHSLTQGQYALTFDPTDGPEVALITEACIWDFVLIDAWDCNGTDACFTNDDPSYFYYNYRIVTITAYLSGAGVDIYVYLRNFQVRVAKFPLPYECVVTSNPTFGVAVQIGYYYLDGCASGNATLVATGNSGITDSPCIMPATIGITIT